MAIETREWDSRFFGYPVGAVSFLEPPDIKADILPVLHQATQAGIRLLYLVTPPVPDRLCLAMQRAGATPVGTKVEYSKNINNVIPDKKSNFICLCSEHSPALESLALQSGFYSRFRMDAGFQNREFERLYSEWLKSSLRGENGKRVYIAGNIHEPHGLITVEPNGIVRIGLLAVGPQWRGQGLGHQLVIEAERFCHRNGHKELSLATQANNQNACRFYDYCGFQRIAEKQYFHAWLPLIESTKSYP